MSIEMQMHMKVYGMHWMRQEKLYRDNDVDDITDTTHLHEVKNNDIPRQKFIR